MTYDPVKAKEYREKNKEKAAIYKKKWREDNAETWKLYWRNYRQKLKIEVMRHYSQGEPICACCGEQMIEFLTLDHINNDGGEHRKQLNLKGGLKGERAASGGWKFYKWLKDSNYPVDVELQVLCFNCNCAKNFYKVCPHVKRPELSDSMVRKV